MKAKKTASKSSVKKTVTKNAAPKKTAAKKDQKEVVAKPAKQPKVVVVMSSDEAKEKQNIIEKFAQKKGDTGSPEVQVALLSHKIDRLADHLNQNKKDNHSRRGLLKVVAKRRRILNYLQKLDEGRYKSLIGSLNLKK